VSPRIGFVLGTGRCGSTLVHEVLARHHDIGFVSNVEDRFAAAAVGARLNQRLYQHVPPARTAKGRTRFAPSEGYRLLEREVSPLLVDPVRDLTAADASPWLTARLRRAFGERAHRQARPVFLHKLTGWPRTGVLDAAFPGARYVHVVRDGRAVASSWVQMPWWRGHLGPERWHFGPLTPVEQAEWDAGGRCFVHLAGIGWRRLLDAYDAARDGLEGRWLEVRYEDVAADPHGQLAVVLAFLGLTPDARFHDWVERSAITGARATAYRDELSPAQLTRLDVALGAHLVARGYHVAPADDPAGDPAGDPADDRAGEHVW
jgi:hypothetical protein